MTVLIPARNEALHIGATLLSLSRQTAQPTTVWVIADNCTDTTADVARGHGAEVYTTIANVHRKAGGLNQLLARLLPTFGPFDAVLVMDADTVMVDDFIERAVAEFDALPELDAVGGVFFGDDAPGLLAQLQRNEYLRYGREISRRQGRVFVLTGTATLFRADALAAVAAARGSVLPGIPGDVYDTYSLTEDNELTIAMKTLGASMVSPRGCRVRTELMPTWRTCGINANAGSAARSRTSACTGCPRRPPATGRSNSPSATASSRSPPTSRVTVLAYLAFGLFTIVVFWVLLGVLFAVERTVTVWPGGWRARLLAAPLLIELGYAIFLQAVYVKSLLDIALGRSKHWNPATVTTPTA